MNVLTRFDYRTEIQPDRTAVLSESGDRLTYAEIDEQARQVAAWCKRQGLGEGDRIAVYLHDTPAYVPAVLGVWRVGAVASPINTRFGLSELDYTLSDLEPSGMLVSDVFADKVAELQDRLDGLDPAAVLEVERDGGFAGDALPDGDDAPGITRRLDGEPAVVMYTSGTTGHPKGVVQTHRNVGAQVDVNVEHFRLQQADAMVVSVPLFHVGGLYGGVLPLLAVGGTIVVQAEWDAAGWGRLVAEHEATTSGLIPTMMLDALNTPEARERDTSSLRYAVYGGSPATEATIAQFREAFDVPHLFNYYGQTEVTGLSVTFGPDAEIRPALLGKPVHAIEHRVVDVAADGLGDVEPGEPGELVVRGDPVTPGYWDESLNPEYFSDGWLHTDDVVREDDEGWLYYVDRADDMIISGGENVAPSEVENALQDHPGVEAVAVFGTPHERWGEAVTAAIVPADHDLTAEDVLDWWDDEAGLAGYKRPRRIEFVEEFPRTATQKIDKVTLAEQVTDE
jgi:acyl-CoA synthetase (AMP-forming)/AMP-acid ligase II